MQLARPASPRSKKLSLAALEREVNNIATDASALMVRVKAGSRRMGSKVNLQQWQRLHKVREEYKTALVDLEQNEAMTNKCIQDTQKVHDNIKATLQDGENLIERLKQVGQKLPEELVLDLMGVVVFACGSLDVIRDKCPEQLEALKNIEYHEYKTAHPYPDIDALRKKLSTVLPSTQEQQGKLDEVLGEHKKQEEELEGKISSLQSEVHALEKKTHSFEEERTSLKRQILDLKTEKDTLAQQNDDLQYELGVQKEVQNKVKSKHKETQDAVKSLEQECAALKTTNDELVSSLNSQLDEEKSRCRDLQAQLRASEGLQNQITSLQSALAQEKQAREEADSTAASDRRRAEVAERDRDANSEALAQERQSTDALHERLRMANQEIESLKAEVHLHTNELAASKKKVGALEKKSAETEASLRDRIANLSIRNTDREAELKHYIEQVARLDGERSGEEQQYQRTLQYIQTQYDKEIRNLERRHDSLWIQHYDQESLHAIENQQAQQELQQLERLLEGQKQAVEDEKEELFWDLVEQKGKEDEHRSEITRLKEDLQRSNDASEDLRQSLLQSQLESEKANKRLADAQEAHEQTCAQLHLEIQRQGEQAASYKKTARDLGRDLDLGNKQLCLLFDVVFDVDATVDDVKSVFNEWTDTSDEPHLSEVKDIFWTIRGPWTPSYGVAEERFPHFRTQVLKLLSMTFRDAKHKNWLPTVLHLLSRIMAGVKVSRFSQVGPIMYLIANKLYEMSTGIDDGDMLLAIALRECVWKVEQRFHNLIGGEQVTYPNLLEHSKCKDPVLYMFEDAIVNGQLRRDVPISEWLQESSSGAFQSFKVTDGTSIGFLTADDSQWFLMLDLGRHSMRLISKQLARVDTSKWPQEDLRIVDPLKEDHDKWRLTEPTPEISTWWWLHLIK
ncbi:hypothetical protein VSDG_10201 [Cytospora chrysosperma]|uniref:Uncharacterized protein n=1 Tax=Cytospora chrysosperma TaxID=252740 RepID=A0A423V7J9_CYTCH|nr:hypothetical protein VSDG_10201 [Valsa sordida]